MAEERFLFVTPDQLAFLISPQRNVGLDLMFGEGNPLGLAPGVHIVIDMTPNEARKVAETLARKADEAEAGLPRA
jgi:hypothetical protein